MLTVILDLQTMRCKTCDINTEPHFMQIINRLSKKVIKVFTLALLYLQVLHFFSAETSGQCLDESLEYICLFHKDADRVPGVHMNERNLSCTVKRRLL